MEADGKICTRCGEWKPLTEYYPHRTRAGFMARCKLCLRQAQNEYRAANRDHVNEQARGYYAKDRQGQTADARRYYAEHTEQVKARERARYEANREVIREKQQAARAANIDHVRAQARRYYAENAEDRRERSRQYAAEHAEQVKAQRKAYREANHSLLLEKRRRQHAANKERELEANRQYKRRNPIANRAREHRRRARKRAAGGSYTAAEWCALCDWFGNVCLSCGATEGLTTDHVIPISAGGPNDIRNLQPLCARCNQRKNAKTIDYRDPAMLAAFLEWLGEQQ